MTSRARRSREQAGSRRRQLAGQDEDLRFYDSLARPVTIVNRWPRGVPASGCPSPQSSLPYMRAVCDWVEFTAGRGAGVSGVRDHLEDALIAYTARQSCCPAESWLTASTWVRPGALVTTRGRGSWGG